MTSVWAYAYWQATSRVLFIKDGQVFHQLYRGRNTNEQMYQLISDTLTTLATGGEQA